MALVKDKYSLYEATLCTFGKHPGWDDHMECLGLDTEVLISFHNSLYNQGINGNIELWEELTERSKQPLLPFNHDFIWQKGDDIIIGRLWYSKDGKGRDRYPMVVCLHGRYIPLSRLLRNVYPLIVNTEKQYAAVSTASDVRAIFRTACERVHEWVTNLSTTVTQPSELTPLEALRTLRSLEQIKRDRNGFYRILFVIEKNLSMKSISARASESSTLYPLRFPAIPGSFTEAAATWTCFLDSQLRRSFPRMFFFPNHAQWCDVIIGEPSVKEFNCLKLPLDNIPLVSNDISIAVDAVFTNRVDNMLETDVEDSGHSIPPLIKIGKRSVNDDDAHCALKMEEMTADSFRKEKELFGRKSLKKIFVVVGLLVAFIIVVFLLSTGQETNNLRSESVNLEARNTIPADGMAPAFEPVTWQNLCMEYHTWFGAFYRELNEGRRKKWSRHDDELKKVVNLLEITSNSGLKIDPLSIANTKGSYQFLADNPPASARTEEAIKHTKNANELVKQIRQILISRQQTVQEFIDNLHQKYAGLGWEGPIQLLNSVRMMFPKADESVSAEITSLFDRYFEFKDKLEVIDKLGDELQDRQEIIISSGDRILSSIDAYVNDRLKGLGNLTEFNRKLIVLVDKKNIMTQLAAFIKNQWNVKRINIDLFKSESKIHRYFDQTVNEDVLSAWLNEVQQFYWLDRDWIDAAKSGWTEALARMHEDVQWLSEINSDKVEQYTQALSVLKKEMQLNIPYIQKYETKLEHLMDSVDRKIKGLAQDIELEKITHSEDPCDWLKNITSFNPEYSGVLKELWNAETNKALNGTTCSQLRADPDRYSKLRKGIDQFQRFLGELDEALPTYFNVVVQKPKKWHGKYFRHLTAVREDYLVKAISLVNWEIGIQNQEFTEFINSGQWTTLRAQYFRWFDGLRTAFTDFQTVDDRLNNGFLPDESIVVDEKKTTLADIVNSWLTGDFIKNNADLEHAIHPFSSRIKRIQSILSEQDISRLTEEALDKQNSLAYTLAIWRQLGTKEWPEDSDDRDVMKRICRRLVTLSSAIENETRVREIQESLKLDKAVYEIRFLRKTIASTLDDLGSQIVEITRSSSNDTSEELGRIKREYDEINGANTINEATLDNRKPDHQDVASFSKLLIRVYQLKRRLDEAHGPHGWKSKNLRH